MHSACYIYTCVRVCDMIYFYIYIYVYDICTCVCIDNYCVHIYIYYMIKTTI